MGGKSSTSKSTVTIPPEVLARYNSVNNYAQQVAQTPFQSYSSDPNAFVAPINAQEQQGIGATNAYANAAQPFYNQAGQQLLSAQSSAVPFYGQAQGSLAGAQTIGNLLGSSSYSALANAQNAAQPFNYAAGQDYNTAYGAAQPYNSGATGLALAGSQAVNPNQIDANAINQFLSPYLGTVLGSTASLLNQNNQQQQAGQLGNAINSGAFGGDRAGIAAANLAQQQNLANANIYSNIANQGFNTALGAAQQQQGVNLGAQQANRAALQEAANQILGIGQQQYTQGMGLGQAQQGLGQQIFGQGTTLGQALAALGQQQFGQGLSASQQQAALGQGLYGMGSQTSQGLANLGTAAQTAGLQGAQAQLAAGQLQQQTQQAGLSALYNQFLQQQSYPFQVAQFLANIAEGTGALSGSTTTTTQPGGFFSDERLKENIRAVGKTFDGQKIYAYNYKGEPRTQVGLLAQEVEKKHPEAVGGHLGYKTVDYGAATDKAAARGRFADGGTPGLGAIPQMASVPMSGQSMMPTTMNFPTPAAFPTPATPTPVATPTSTPAPTPALGANSTAPANLAMPSWLASMMGSQSGPMNIQSMIDGIMGRVQSQLPNGQTQDNWHPASFADLGRRHHAEGGRIGKAEGGILLPGLDPTFMQMILQANAQSHGPYGNAGLYGGSAYGEPRGGSSYVPSASLPVGNLTVASPPTEAPKSGLSQIKDIASAADTIKGGIGAIKGKGSTASKLSDFTNKTLDDMPEYPVDTGYDNRIHDNAGGRAHRATGGMNDDEPIETYADQFGPKLKIPNVHSNLKLAQADPPSQQGGGGLGDILGIAGSIIPFLASGGVAHKADGGANEDEIFTPDPNGDPRTLAFLKRLLADDDSTSAPSPGLGAVIPALASAPPPVDIPAVTKAQMKGNPSDIDAAVRMIYGEAAGEPDLGKIAALQVFMNRSKKSGKSLAAEIMKPNQSEAMTNGVNLDPNSKAYQNILNKIVLPVFSGDAPNPIGDKTHFLNPDLQTKLGRSIPKWAQEGGQRIGNHVFYMADGGDVTPSQDDLDADAQPLPSVKKALEVVQAAKQPQVKPIDAALMASNNNEPDQEAYAAPAVTEPQNLLTGTGLGAAQATEHHGFLSGLGQRLAHPGNKPDLIVPILEGLAAMGTAPTRHFGVALAAGLGAGAHGYQEQKQYQQEQQRIAQNQQLVNANVIKNTLGFANQRFLPLGQGQWRDLVRGDVIDNNEHANRLAMGITATMPGGSSQAQNALSLATNSGMLPTGNEPQAAPSPTVIPQNPQEVVKTAAPSATLADHSPVGRIYAKVDSDPSIAPLKSQIDALNASAEDAMKKANDPTIMGTPAMQNYLSQAENQRSQANALKEQYFKLRDSLAGPDIAAYQNSRAQTIKIQQDSKSEAADQAKDAIQAMNNAHAAMSLLFDEHGNPLIAGGPLASHVGNLGALLEQAGIGNDTVTALLGTNPNNQIELEKLKTTLGTEVARQQLAGSQIRVSEFNQFMKTVPSADIPTEAAKWLIEHTIVPQAKIKLGAWDKVKDLDPLSDDIRGTLVDYGRKNPWFAPPKTAPAPKLIDGKLYRGKNGETRRYDAKTNSFVVP